GDAVLPRRAAVDCAGPAAGCRGQPGLVPDGLAVAARGPVEVPGGGGVGAGGVPGPVVLQLGAADGGDPGAARRPARGGVGVDAAVALLLVDATGAVVTRGGEDGVVLGGGVLVDGVEVRGLLLGRTAEGLLGDAEALR